MCVLRLWTLRALLFINNANEKNYKQSLLIFRSVCLFTYSFIQVLVHTPERSIFSLYFLFDWNAGTLCRMHILNCVLFGSVRFGWQYFTFLFCFFTFIPFVFSHRSSSVLFAGLFVCSYRVYKSTSQMSEWAHLLQLFCALIQVRHFDYAIHFRYFYYLWMLLFSHL